MEELTTSSLQHDIPDYRDGLSGEVPGNISGEHGSHDGAAPETIICDHGPGAVPTQNDDEANAKIANARADLEANRDEIIDHQVQEYVDGKDYGKEASRTSVWTP